MSITFFYIILSIAYGEKALAVSDSYKPIAIPMFTQNLLAIDLNTMPVFVWWALCFSHILIRIKRPVGKG